MAINPFYTPSGTPATSSKGASAPIRAEFASIAAGFAAIPGKIGTSILFSLKGANMNTTTDQAFVPYLWSSGNYRIDQILAYNNTGAAPSVATGGIYTGASKSGTVIIPAAEPFSDITGGGLIKVLDFAPGGSLNLYSSSPYLSLTTAQGATCTLDFVIMGIILP